LFEPEHQLSDLAVEIKRGAPTAVTEVNVLPSAVVMLDIHLSERLFVVCFIPNHGFGVDEIQEGDGIGNWYRFMFPDFEQARTKLLEIMNIERPS
jgi:hypothetical protein